MHAQRQLRNWKAPLVVMASLAVFAPSLAVAAPSASPLAYPPAERTDHVDTYWGTEVADPYRWLEDPEDPRTTAWVEAEERLARDFLEALPTHASRETQMTELLVILAIIFLIVNGIYSLFHWHKDDLTNPLSD